MQNAKFLNIEEVREMITTCKHSLRHVEVESEEQKSARMQDIAENSEFQHLSPQTQLTGLISNLRKVHRKSITKAKASWENAGGRIGAMMMATKAPQTGGRGSFRGSISRAWIQPCSAGARLRPRLRPRLCQPNEPSDGGDAAPGVEGPRIVADDERHHELLTFLLPHKPALGATVPFPAVRK
mmetsp:Transcript_21991/g.71081  ORF Transcript_21991/g.71081 Transcript_21991/m.71081 type:complete len:183 (-) Transcript_21991:46-594(-)